MSSKLKDKVEEMQVGKNIKETASALVSDVKEIAKDTKEAADDTFDQVRKNTKEVLQKVEKKLP
jgi:ElaB/YqjD/DUF883 family membrane-anchored ribosome-binding protein